MTTEYQDSIREGFEVYIAKQLKLDAVPKDVLAVQVFALNVKLEYVDKKLQTKWGEWKAACSQQIETDAKIAESWGDEKYKKVGGMIPFSIAGSIRKQGKCACGKINL